MQQYSRSEAEDNVSVRHDKEAMMAVPSPAVNADARRKKVCAHYAHANDMRSTIVAAGTTDLLVSVSQSTDQAACERVIDGPAQTSCNCSGQTKAVYILPVPCCIS
jgi:hypothetical protein